MALINLTWTVQDICICPSRSFMDHSRFHSKVGVMRLVVEGKAETEISIFVPPPQPTLILHKVFDTSASCGRA